MANLISKLPALHPFSKKSHVCNTLYIDLLYRRVVHVLTANSESSGQFIEENSSFKRKGRLDFAGASYQTNEPCIYKLDSIIQVSVF